MTDSPDLDGRGGTALTRCVALPDSSDLVGDFAALHWGRRPLLSRAVELSRATRPGALTRPAERAGFADLLDAVAVDELVSARGLRTPFLRMARDGDVLPAATFTRGGGAGATIGDQAADDRILAAMADGSTLVLQALHRTWPPLVAFGSQLAAELGHPVQINAYVTPPQNQGFAPHYDVHDVFVLQVAGRKHWTVHEPVVADPLDNQPWEAVREQVAARATETPLIDTVLEPGDALYLPRGTIHSAAALGTTSIHLTVGVHPLTRYHLVRRLLDAVQDDPQLRRSLPMGTDLADPDVLTAHLTATLDALHAALAEVPVARVADGVGLDLMRRTRPEPIGPLAQLAAADSLTAHSPVRLRAGLRRRVEHSDDGVRIVLLDRTVTLPLAARDAVKTVLAGAAFTPAELPGLDADEQLVLARRLVREGVLVPA